MFSIQALLFVGLTFGGGESTTASSLPDAGEVILRQLIEDHKELLSRFGYQRYDGQAWTAMGNIRAPEEAVILVHGLDEMGTVWEDMAPALHGEGHQVLRFSYPNDQAITRSAILFRQQLKWLRERGAKKVSLVAHSMGGLICRDALTRSDTYEGPMPEVKHLITLGTPNHGAPLAMFRHVAEWREHILRMGRGEGEGLGPIIDGMGEAAEDLSPDSDYLKELNGRPLPKTPMTIIAGRIDKEEAEGKKKKGSWEVPWVTKTWQKAKLEWKGITKKVGDGVVPLDSTPLKGVEDYRIIKGNHRAIVKNFFKSKELPLGVKIVIEALGKGSTKE